MRAIVEREIDALIVQLGIRHWHLQFNYELRDDAALGDCSRKIDYDHAYIRLDPEGMRDEAQVLEVLRHELFHVVLSPFDLFERAVANAGLPEAIVAVLGRIWDHSCEKAVINLERVYEGMTPKPAKAEAPAKAKKGRSRR